MNKTNSPQHDLIQEVLAGGAGKEDAKRVAQWFATPEGQKYLSKQMDLDFETMAETEELFIDHDVPTSQMLNDIDRKIRNRHIWLACFRVAAILIPIVLFSSLLIHVQNNVDLFNNAPYEEVYVPKGERVHMVFQDGTDVYLNSDTRLSFRKKFAFSKREITLNGEAYFKVSKNKHRPFLIHTNGGTIKVLGTSFNVQAYSDSKKIDVTLDEGSIQWTTLQNKEVQMSPGQHLTYDRSTGKSLIDEPSLPENFSAWKKNVVTFKDCTLDEMLNILNRWYGVEFNNRISKDEGLQFTYTSQNNATLESVLKDIERIAPLTFEQKGNLIIVKKTN